MLRAGLLPSPHLVQLGAHLAARHLRPHDALLKVLDVAVAVGAVAQLVGRLAVHLTRRGLEVPVRAEGELHLGRLQCEGFQQVARQVPS